MRSPTSLLPVKVTFLTRGSATKGSPILLPEPVMHCTASAGAPASRRISVSFSAESGVSVAGLMITELPAARAGPTLCATRLSGKLNGLIAATTPTGTRMVKPYWPVQFVAPSKGIVSPYRRLASSPESSIVCFALSASASPSPMILPSSIEIVRPNSSWRSVKMSAARRRISKRR